MLQNLSTFVTYGGFSQGYITTNIQAYESEDCTIITPTYKVHNTYGALNKHINNRKK